MDKSDKTIHKLNRILEKEPIDWSAFDEILSKVSDINYLDEKNNKTLLSWLIGNGDFYQNGAALPAVVVHFLNNGYDVKAHGGRNGVFVLRQLCWSSYDKYILDTAKILLDSGASIDYEPEDDERKKETDNVIGSIEWKLDGAWYVDQDYTWANIITSYYHIINAFQEGKDYRLISSFTEAIGQKLTSVSVIEQENGVEPITVCEDITTFQNALVFYFGETPLLVKSCVEFEIDPITVDESKERIKDVSCDFSHIIGASLKCIQYIDPNMCFIDFDNGSRILLTCLHEQSDYIGALEFMRIAEINLEILNVNSICRRDSWSNPKTVTQYDEESIALFSDTAGYLLYTVPIGDFSYRIAGIKCSRKMLRNYIWQFPMEKPEEIRTFHKSKTITALRFKFGSEYLYMRTSKYVGLDLWVCDSLFNPNKEYLDYTDGKHVEFKKSVECSSSNK